MFAMGTLKAGFTIVRDVDSSAQEMYAMRDVINTGWIQDPRIIAAERLLQPCCESAKHRHPALTRPGC
jgi:hypothetical protein